MKTKMETDIKCRGCKKDIPKEHYDINTKKATWYGTYIDDTVIEWVCVDCWDKGVRWEGYRKHMSR